MIAIKRNCLDHAELQLVVNGGFPLQEFDSAISHLDDCDECRSAIERMERDGNWMREALIGEEADPLQAETACQVALWRMMETPTVAVTDELSGSVPQETLGPYRLLRPLGTGGMGTVYLAQHERLRRQCAIKLLPRERVDQPGWLDRFDREMTTVASLEHTNVVRATDAGHQDGWHYLVMEYLDGLDVGRIASRMDKLEVADACEIVRQAALGLAHVHASGLVHRDVKPSNLMLTRSGIVKLLDLGLVLPGDDPLAVDDRLTTVGHLMGTMPYMAPEQLVDSRDVDRRADIYALGATLYRLIAGQPPHPRRGGLAKHVMAITQQDAPRLDTVREELDRDVVELVSEMLSRDPSKRPRDMTEVAQRLVPLASGSGVKRLLRQALRKKADGTHPVSLLQTAVGRDAPRDHRGGKFLIAAAMGAFLLLAGFLIKIETDYGDLTVKSDHDNLVVAVKKGEKVIKRLEIESGDDNRITLRKGTYIVEIEGASGGFTLDQSVVTIGRGETSPIHVQENNAPLYRQRIRQPRANQQLDYERSMANSELAAIADAASDFNPLATTGELLYQGKDLAAWRGILVREQDPNALGQAMRAVEVLTRGTDQRMAAAKDTLRTARKWGGIVSSGTGSSAANSSFDEQSEPSPRYMGYLLEVFPKYLDEPALRAIDVELKEGNSQSRIASIWLLHNALRKPSGNRFDAREEDLLATVFHDVEGKDFLRTLYEHLKRAVTSLNNADNDKRFQEHASEMGETVGLSLRRMMDEPIADEVWLRTSVVKTIEKSLPIWRTGNPNPDPAIGSYFSYMPWIVSEDVLAAAVEMDGSDGFNAPWEFMAAVLIDPLYRRKTAASEAIFDAVARHEGEALLNLIETRLQELNSIPVSETDGSGGFTSGGGGLGGGGFGGGGFGGGFLQTVSQLISKNSVWPKALEFYSEQTNDPASSLELLTHLRESLEKLISSPPQQGESMEAIDAAIKKLRDRSAKP